MAIMYMCKLLHIAYYRQAKARMCVFLYMLDNIFILVGMPFLTLQITALVSYHVVTTMTSYCVNLVTYEPDSLQLPPVNAMIFYAPNNSGNLSFTVYILRM